MDYIRHCRVHRVIDGDTLDVMVDLGFRRFSRERIRIAGIDTPEIRGPGSPDGFAAKSFTQQWCDHAQADGPLILVSHQADSFGRWLGTITRPSGESLADELIDRGYAVPYVR